MAVPSLLHHAKPPKSRNDSISCCHFDFSGLFGVIPPYHGCSTPTSSREPPEKLKRQHFWNPVDPPISPTFHVSPLESSGLQNNPLESSGPFYLSNFTLFVSPLDSTGLYNNSLESSGPFYLSTFESTGFQWT